MNVDRAEALRYPAYKPARAPAMFWDANRWVVVLIVAFFARGEYDGVQTTRPDAPLNPTVRGYTEKPDIPKFHDCRSLS